MVKGENLEAKRQFIEAEGVEFVLKMMNDYQGSKRIKIKAMTLMKDLVLYDFKLHHTFSNLEKFSNTNQKMINERKSMIISSKEEEESKKNNIRYDPVDDMKKI